MSTVCMMPTEKKKSLPKVPTAIRLDNKIKEELESAARDDGRTMSGLIERIVVQWLTERRKSKAEK